MKKSTPLGQLEGVKRWADLDIDDLCQTALANLGTPTTEIQRLTFQDFATKVMVAGQEIRLSLALPLDQADGAFELQPL